MKKNILLIILIITISILFSSCVKNKSTHEVEENIGTTETEGTESVIETEQDNDAKITDENTETESDTDSKDNTILNQNTSVSTGKENKTDNSSCVGPDLKGYETIYQFIAASKNGEIKTDVHDIYIPKSSLIDYKLSGISAFIKSQNGYEYIFHKENDVAGIKEITVSFIVQDRICDREYIQRDLDNCVRGLRETSYMLTEIEENVWFLIRYRDPRYYPGEVSSSSIITYKNNVQIYMFFPENLCPNMEMARSFYSKFEFVKAQG